MYESKITDLLIKISFNEDRLSFKKLYFYFYDDLLRFAKSFVKQDESAEEIVDDAFIKIWSNRSKLYQVNNIKVYLFVCIKNLCINYLEKHKNIHIISIEDIDFEPYNSRDCSDNNLHLAETEKIISGVVNGLTPQAQLVFQLVKVDGLKYKEAAEVLNVSLKTIEYHITNTLRKIAEALLLLSK